MSEGLKIWDSSGVLKLDTSDYVGRIKGMDILSAGASGSITVSINPGENIFAVLTLTTSQNETGELYVVGNVINYSLSSGTAGYIVYGVY